MVFEKKSCIVPEPINVNELNLSELFCVCINCCFRALFLIYILGVWEVQILQKLLSF